MMVVVIQPKDVAVLLASGRGPDRGKYKIHRDRISRDRLRILFQLFPQDP
jgi:hypothetical protein